MNPDTADTVHFLLVPGQRVSAGPLGRRLAPIFQRPALDVSQELRYGGGWIARDVGPELAERLRRELEDEGIDHVTVPARGRRERPTGEIVRSVTFDGKRIELELSDARKVLPIEELQLIDFLAVGVPAEEGEEEPEEKEPSTSDPEPPFAAPRRALLALDLDRVHPHLYLLRRSPIEFLLIEPGTHFPHYAEVMGGLWVDNLLTFLHHLFSRVASRQVTVETREFWESGQLENVLVHKSEELWNRLSWLAEITSHGLWGVDLQDGAA